MLGTWFRLQIKIQLKKRSTWIAVLLVALLYLTVQNICIQNVQMKQVGYYAGASNYGIRLFEKLSAQAADGFLFVAYDDPKVMQADVTSGALICAFGAADDLDEKVSDHDLTQGITLYMASADSGGILAKEHVYAAFLELYGAQVLYEHEHQLFGRSDEWLEDRLNAYYDAYLEQLELVTLEMINKDRVDINSEVKSFEFEGWMLDLAIGLLLLCVLMIGQVFGSDEQDAVTIERMQYVPRRDRFVFLRYLAMLGFPWLTAFLFAFRRISAEPVKFIYTTLLWCVILCLTCFGAVVFRRRRV